MVASPAGRGLARPHMAVVRRCVLRRRPAPALEFPAGAPDALVMLGKACIELQPADRPSFDDILEILAPLNAVLQGAASSNQTSAQNVIDGACPSSHEPREAGRSAGCAGPPPCVVGGGAYLGDL